MSSPFSHSLNESYNRITSRYMKISPKDKIKTIITTKNVIYTLIIFSVIAFFYYKKTTKK